MASITIRNLSAESKARLPTTRRNSAVCSLEALVRSLSRRRPPRKPRPTGSFPHNLIALGSSRARNIEPFIREHRQPQEPIEPA